MGQEGFCAVGWSGPTYHREDALSHSKDLALTELARQVQVRVQSQMEIRQRGGSVGRDHMRIQETASFSADSVVNQAEVRGIWVNPGWYPSWGETGTTYTLVCMPDSFLQGR